MASKEILRRKLRLGVVTSQHPSAKERSMSAAAMIVDSNADDTSPVVWVHNNRLGSGEESNGAIQQSVHWQVFGPQNDLSGPMEVKRWGIVRPVEEFQNRWQYLQITKDFLIGPHADVRPRTYSCDDCSFQIHAVIPPVLKLHNHLWENDGDSLSNSGSEHPHWNDEDPSNEPPIGMKGYALAFHAASFTRKRGPAGHLTRFCRSFMNDDTLSEWRKRQ
ncbi:hypothetical protein BofuT4_P061060.1 [Botrytis cinerea T4]|uniref:Uncharacterized protein n=1 Tax=Botryotinia fuckeliana (strain T4) TaxID=999810 RepID=G2XTS6_BOTF4|nr:hypothetical protein BofuT4_P061060.1 [Botrytis cinerea T4]